MLKGFINSDLCQNKYKGIKVMKYDDVTEETIKILVDTFYLKVRQDSDLSPIFINAIGQDTEAWQPHLQHMYDFWSSIMLSSRRFQGNPMQKHKNLPAFDSSLFDRWLELFELTAHEVHSKEMAEKYIVISRRIAESLKLGLYFRG